MAPEADNLGMGFEARLEATHKGGTMLVSDQKITIAGASEVVIRVTCATSFNGFDKSPATEGVNPTDATKQFLTASPSQYEALCQTHLADYQSLFNRSQIQLGDPSGPTSPPDHRQTDRVVRQWQR